MKYATKNTLLVGSLCDADEAIFSLNAALNNKEEFLFTLYNVAVAQGFSAIAERSGLGKESLYKSVSPHSHPRFETILKIIRAMGFDMKIVPAKGIFRSPKFIRPNSLAYTYPEIAAEWHVIQNDMLTPNDIMPGSKKNVWWLCSKNSDHAWQASCNARTQKDAKCPLCS